MPRKSKPKNEEGCGVAKLTAARLESSVKGTNMNNNTTLSILNHAVTMSSREIAELTGKSHSNVMRDIRTMMASLKKDSNLNPLCETTSYVGSNGIEYDQYELDKDTCLTLLLGYDAVARMKVIKRWQELETRQYYPMQMLNDPAALRNLLIGYTERVETLEHKIEQDKPKVQFAERHVKAEGWSSIRDTAKQIGVREREFIRHLLADGYVYRSKGSGRLVPYADAIKRGLMDVKIGVIALDDGTEKTTQQTMVLAKGIQHFQRRYAVEEVSA